MDLIVITFEELVAPFLASVAGDFLEARRLGQYGCIYSNQYKAYSGKGSSLDQVVGRAPRVY
jgi:hypothetical protein